MECSFRTKSDWIVKLIDVYPDDYRQDKKMAGYQLMVANEILRGRFRRSFEKPSPITPNRVEEYTMDMRASNYTFKKGHRVVVQVQSTWFPLYDRNPQKFVENIFEASPSDYQPATQRVYQSARYPSRGCQWCHRATPPYLTDNYSIWHRWHATCWLGGGG